MIGGLGAAWRKEANFEAKNVVSCYVSYWNPKQRKRDERKEKGLDVRRGSDATLLAFINH